MGVTEVPKVTGSGAALKGLRSEPGITTFLCYLFGTEGQRSVLSRCPNILSGCYSSADVFLESL